MTGRRPRPVDRLPRSLLAMVAVCILGLLAGIVLSYAYAQKVNHRLSVLEQYVQGRGEYRDQEQKRLEEQIRRSTCDLLDQLPQGRLLDGPRAKYHCGPGLPAGTIPGGNKLNVSPPAAPATASSSPVAGSARASVPAPAGTTRGAPSATSSPVRSSPGPIATPSAPSRRSPLAPVTDPLCDAFGVCP